MIYFLFRGRAKTKMSVIDSHLKSWEGRFDEGAPWLYILKELMFSFEVDSDNPSYYDASRTPFQIDTTCYSPGTIIDLMEFLDWEGDVLYRNDEDDPFLVAKFERTLKPYSLTVTTSHP